MKLIAYPTMVNPPKLVRAAARRDWMDDAANKNPYRCLPLSMANAWGWQLLSQGHFIAEWNGGPRHDDVKITNLGGTMNPVAHFGEGTLTWHLGYVFNTEYPYGIYMTGAPNNPKPNVIPLSGLVETHWLPYTATMNWRFTQPGIFEMKIGEPFCHLFPVNMDQFNTIEPEIRSMNEPEAKEFHDLYWEWNLSRGKFMAEQRQGVHTSDVWQRHYFRGTHPPDGVKKCPVHINSAGETESNHKTKPNVPEFVDKQTLQFTTPDFYWKRSKEIDEMERQLEKERLQRHQAEQATITTAQTIQPTPTQAKPIEVGNVDFETKMRLFREHLAKVAPLTAKSKNKPVRKSPARKVVKKKTKAKK